MQFSYLPHSQSQDRYRNPLVRAALPIICLLLAGIANASPPPKTPDFGAVIDTAKLYFASQPDYQNGDLIRRSQIEGVLKSVASAGWKVHKARGIVELGLPDSSFLVREFSTPNGKKFMRKISAQPGGFAHLDRLSTIPRGQETVRQLIRTPGGHEMITYLATTKSGHKLGQTMGGVRGGVDLDKSTGRIYTANDLLAVLQQLHQKSVN